VISFSNHQSTIINQQSIVGETVMLSNHQSTIINNQSTLRILLVEDNRIYREAFKDNLRQHFPSMVIDEAATAEEALPKIKGTPPQLIFIDIRLPGMNGLQLTQKIKRDFPNIRIAIVTGYDIPEYRQAATQYGADRFFVKESLNWEEIDALVKEVSV